jgi:diguanylate cyclase (GGDEF)-like protein
MSEQLKILIIDDDIVDRMSIKRAIKKSQLDAVIVEAENALQGEEFIASASYDIILLDLHMPCMNGLELLEKLSNQQTSFTAVIVLSHIQDEDMALMCIKAGAQDFIPKHEVNDTRLLRAILHAQERYAIQLNLTQSRDSLEKLAKKDTLTGLANRYWFDTIIQSALPSALRTETYLGLVLLDLDNFKAVNDTYGHDIGDALLQRFAQKLKSQVREGDEICRLGGDEFAIIVNNLTSIEEILFLVDRIYGSLKSPVLLNNISLEIKTSMGISCYPDNANSPEELLKTADIALYKAKAQGRNQYHFFSPTTQAKISAHATYELRLLQAAEKKAFELFYQPQINHNEASLSGVEVSIRWRNDDGQFEQPSVFMPMLSQLKLMPQIGLWAFETACSQLSLWRKKVPGLVLRFSLAIPVTSIEVCSDTYLDKILSILKVNDLNSDAIELEITEDTISQMQEPQQWLGALTDAGFKIVLDGFDAHQGSLHRLQACKASALKIDSRFIQESLDSVDDYNFLRAIVAFARTLDIEIIAKGIETDAQFALCKSLNFSRLQGKYYDSALPCEGFESRWLDVKSKYSRVG